MTVQKPPEVIAGGGLLAGKYRIIEPIGRGGMGVVYKAGDTQLERTVALKFLPPELTGEPEARERFMREAKAAAALSHNHICDIHEIGEEENQLFIVMEYIKGESLKQKILKGPFNQAEALDIAIQVAKGLEEAHKKGIVHRDIKPGNIMVTDEGTAKVMDFGLAKALGKSLITKEAKTMGTVAYMSPEQAQAQSVDHRTDIWSLGVVLYEMLTGQLPFKGEYEQSIIHSILNRAPEPITRIRKDMPSGLEQVIGKSLEKNPADRYQGMQELLEDLKAIAEGLKPLRAKAGLFRGRILGIKKVYAYTGLACLFVLIASAIVFLLPKRGQAYDSIAVLPLQNISGDPEQESFCDGVHQELITQLSRIKAIKKVIAKSSMMGYKDTKKKISEIAGELKVAALVAGGANRSGNRVRINFEIIDGQTDKLIGGDQFDGEYRDILALQSEAALAIAQKIQASLTPEETRIIANTRPVNPEAHEAYLKGMFIIGSLDQLGMSMRPELEKSIQFFEQAIKIDPSFAPGYAGLAWGYDFSALTRSPNEVIPKARDAALKAMSLDDSLADAHAVLADIKTVYDWDWEGAEGEYRRALHLNPNHAFAHFAYGLFLAGQGRGEEAVSHAERALELDPHTLTTVRYGIHIFGLARQFERAISLAKESLNLFANSRRLHLGLGRLYIGKSLFKEALAEFQKMVELGAPPNNPFLACAYALTGEKSKALDIVHSLLKQAEEGYADPYHVACAYAALGEKNKAFEWLEKAYEQRNPNMYVLKAEYILYDLQDDPRFTALLKKLKLDK
jgi:serine/threonine-protein kinase